MTITRRGLGRLALPLLLRPIGAAGAEAPERLALVIGNGSYLYNDPLPNAISDARKLATMLPRFGFSVDTDTFDLGKEKLLDVITSFGNKLRSKGQNLVALFYYAGHAAQDNSGVNYLLPVDAKADTPDDVRSVGAPMQLIMQAMEDADNPINIVVLDACRDWFKNDTAHVDPKGLHDMGLHASMIIAYATRADDTAKEGSGLDSSPYSRRLLEAFEKQSSDPFVLLLDDVKSKVYSDTDAGQYPLLVDGLTVSGRWSLASKALNTVPDKPQPVGVQIPQASFLALLDQQKLTTFFRNKQTFIDSFLASRDVLEKFGINTPLRLAHFLGAIGHETGGFQLQEEKFGFHPDALLQRWPKEMKNQTVARQVAAKGVEYVADFVYANRLGNGSVQSGDGWRYRGRGLLFIVGKGNYRKYGQMIGVDLVAAPDLANDLEIGFATAAAYWSTVGSNKAADADDLRRATILFRGLYNKDEARKIWLKQAKIAVGLNDSGTTPPTR